MTRPLNSDPLRNFRFQVKIINPLFPGLLHLGFMAVSGLAVQNEIIPYREGGNNTTTRKMPGQSDYGPISFTRGLMSSPTMTPGNAGSGLGAHVGDVSGGDEAFSWFTQIFSVQAGGGFGTPTADFRGTANVDVLQHPITDASGYAAGVDNPPAIKARFQIFNCWPMGLSFSDLEAGGNAVIIENLTLAHEGWLMITAPSNAPGTFLSPSAGYVS